MDKHIPHTGDRKPKVIPGWDIEMDCARQSSLFWHSMWNECGRKQSGIVYDTMKKIGQLSFRHEIFPEFRNFYDLRGHSRGNPRSGLKVLESYFSFYF